MPMPGPVSFRSSRIACRTGKGERVSGRPNGYQAERFRPTLRVPGPQGPRRQVQHLATLRQGQARGVQRAVAGDRLLADVLLQALPRAHQPSPPLPRDLVRGRREPQQLLEPTEMPLRAGGGDDPVLRGRWAGRRRRLGRGRVGEQGAAEHGVVLGRRQRHIVGGGG